MEDLYNRLLISTTHFDVIYVIFVSLGGEAAIDAVVERFYDILLADDRVSGLFANTDMKHQRAMQKMFLNHVFGGKQYDGKNMRDAHSRLSLTDDHFNAVAEDLIRTLNELGVPQDKIDAVMAVVATTKNDVLGRSA
jgi:hemoglobin